MKKKTEYIVGVDEVGRGPIAGPMTLCAVVIPESFDMKKLIGVDDSKKMTKIGREEWSKKAYEWKKEGKINFYIRSVSAKKIDKIGLTKSIKFLLKGVLLNVDEKKSEIKLDGLLYAPERFKNQETIKGGDGIEKVISLASVIAKVYRDKKMKKLSLKYPDYGFENHVGYGTKAHYLAIEKYGITKEHRNSFLKNI